MDAIKLILFLTSYMKINAIICSDIDDNVDDNDDNDNNLYI